MLRNQDMLELWADRAQWQTREHGVEQMERHTQHFADAGRFATLLEERVGKTEAGTKLLGHDFMMAADIEMQYYLVPKLWVKEIVLRRIANFTHWFAQFQSGVNPKGNDLLLLKRNAELAGAIVPQKDFIVREQFEGLRREIYSGAPHFLTAKQNELLGCNLRRLLQFVPPLPAGLSKQRRYLQAWQDAITKKVMVPGRLVFARRVVLTRQPQFSIAERLARTDRPERVALAHTKLSLAMRSLGSSAFYGHIYHAALMLTAEDFYLPILEALTSRQKDASLPAAQKSKLSKAMLLLDAHVFQKVNDYRAMTGGLLNFVRAAYEDLSTGVLSKLVLQIVYQSAFSFKMYNYKESHGGLLIKFADYAKYIDPDQAADKQVAFELPQLWVKPATLGQITEAVSWVAAICQGINKGQDEQIDATTYLTYFADVVLFMLANFTGEELLPMAKELGKIVSAVQSSHMAADVKKKRLGFIALVSGLGGAQTPAEIKRVAAQTKGTRDSGIFCKVSTP